MAEQLRRAVPGGIGTYARGLVGGLSRLGPDGPGPVTLYASRSPATPDPLAALPAELRTSVLPGKVLSRAWDHGVVDAPSGFAVVHALSLLTPPSRHAALAVTVHDLAWRHVPEAYPGRGRRWHERALARAVDRADVFVVPSAAVADEIVDAGVDRSRVHVIPHGSDHLPPPDEPGAEAVLRGLGVGGEFVLSVSTLEPRKNLARLVEAYGAARLELPEPWPLVVVGPRGWGRHGVPARAGDGVVLAGAVSGGILAALYRRARLLAYVPLVEGFGFPALEAMAAGTPVVASAMPSTGDAVWEVDPTDVGALSDAILRVAGDSAVRDGLSDAGRSWAATHMWVESARAHRRVWESLR